MQSTSRAVAPRSHPRAHEVLELMMRQRDLQPHLRFPGPQTRAIASTCRVLRPHHPMAQDDATTVRVRYMDAMLARRPRDRGQHVNALRQHHAPNWHGPLAQLLDNCRDTVWMADAWFGTAPRDRPVPQVDAEERRHCLAYLWAVRGFGTVEEGLHAVDQARQVDPIRLMSLLALDAAEATVAVAAMGAAFGAGVAWGAWLGSAAGNAWRGGTVFGKTKAVALGVGAAGGSLLGISAAIACGALGYQRVRNRRQEREQQLATQYGRDAIFCELVTGRRYRRDAARAAFPDRQAP